MDFKFEKNEFYNVHKPTQLTQPTQTTTMLNFSRFIHCSYSRINGWLQHILGGSRYYPIKYWYNGNANGFELSVDGLGRIDVISYWSNHNLHGTTIDLHCKNLKAISRYKNDKQHGVYIEWYNNGLIREVSHWDKDSYHGLYVQYDRQGQLEEISERRDHLLHGIYLKYRSGRLIDRRYCNGELIPELMY